MPNFTKRAIKEAFVALLDERPLNKITVKDVVEACGINRNSFYYHFQDLPALLEEIIAQQVQELIQAHRRGAGVCPGEPAGGAPHLQLPEPGRL